MPGAIFLAGTLYSFDLWSALTLGQENGNQFATFSTFALLSYVFGLIANILSGLLPGLDIRGEDHSEFLNLRVVSEYEDFFGKKYDGTAWKWCYGIVTKHGYAVNTDFFLGVFVFCSSVFTSLLCIVPLLVYSWLVNNSPFYPVIVVLAACLAFWKGSRKYSRVFSISILEAFYSYKMDNRS